MEKTPSLFTSPTGWRTWKLLLLFPSLQEENHLHTDSKGNQRSSCPFNDGEWSWFLVNLRRWYPLSDEPPSWFALGCIAGCIASLVRCCLLLVTLSVGCLCGLVGSGCWGWCGRRGGRWRCSRFLLNIRLLSCFGWRSRSLVDRERGGIIVHHILPAMSSCRPVSVHIVQTCIAV